MKYSKDRVSSNNEIRNEDKNFQPESIKNKEPGFGDKKLEGPNRPSV